VRAVPAPAQRPDFLTHPRLRRAGALTQLAVAAALEALGEDSAAVQANSLRLRIVVCLMPGCVTYSRRFYEEVLQNPETASPLLFPETVFNAPASHLAAYLNTSEASYTLVGDDTSFLQGLALAANWLLDGQADGCLVTAAEEMDWIVADAVQLFTRRVAQASGAGALYLRADGRGEPGVAIACITDAFSFTSRTGRAPAVRAMRAQLTPFTRTELLCLGIQGLARADREELAAWHDWPDNRLTPKRILGEAFTASAAWQCVAACDKVQRREFEAANVSVVGAIQQTVGARFVAT